MKQDVRNALLFGTMLLIFGPLTGWIICAVGDAESAKALLNPPPDSLPNPQFYAAKKIANLFPFLLGITAGAVGLFIDAAAVIFWIFREQ